VGGERLKRIIIVLLGRWELNNAHEDPSMSPPNRHRGGRPRWFIKYTVCAVPSDISADDVAFESIRRCLSFSGRGGPRNRFLFFKRIVYVVMWFWVWFGGGLLAGFAVKCSPPVLSNVSRKFFLKLVLERALRSCAVTVIRIIIVIIADSFDELIDTRIGFRTKTRKRKLIRVPGVGHPVCQRPT